MRAGVAARFMGERIMGFRPELASHFFHLFPVPVSASSFNPVSPGNLEKFFACSETFHSLRSSAVQRSSSILLVIAALLGMISTPAFAGSKKKASPPPVQHPPVISSVTANSISVVDDKVTKTLTITQFTEINVNGRRANVTDLKPGMTVSITLGTDPSQASRINATGK